MAFDMLVREGHENCRYCGQCLQQCTYLSLSPSEAVEEIHRLREGDPVHTLDSKCISCYSCETFCENSGHPYLAMQQRRRDRYRLEGLPRQVLFMLTSGHKNFRAVSHRYMSVSDKALLGQWAENEKQECFDDLLFPGCNLLTTPSLADIELLEDVTVAGSLDRCCGEMFFRLGLIDEAQATARKLEAFYAKKKIKRMLFVCPAGYNMFQNVMPDLFDVHFDFEKIYFTDWLIERMAQGKFEVKHPLQGDFRIHDSCHARVLGDPFLAKVRQVIELLGGKVITDPHPCDGKGSGKGSGEEYCCGAAAGAQTLSVVGVLRAAHKAMKQQAKKPSGQTVAYCTGCALTLTLTGILLPGSVQVQHLLQLVAKAGGQERRSTMRSLLIPSVRAILRDGTPTLFSRKRGFISNIK